MHSTDSTTLNEGQQLFNVYHRTISGRHLPVVAESSEVVAPPTLQSVHGSSGHAHPSAANWVVSCDVIGFDKKQQKEIKVRFHPSAFQMAQSDSCLLKAALKEAKELVSTMTMDTVWTMDEKCPMESLEQKLRHLSQIIANIKADVVVQGGSLRLTWLISGPSTIGNPKLKTSISEAKDLFSNGCHFTNHLVVNVEQANDKQLATVRYEKPDHKRELMKLILGGNDYLAEGRHTVIIKMDDNRLSLSFSRLVPSVESSAISGCSLPPKIPDSLHGEVVVAKDTTKNMMIDFCQLRVEDLHRRLDESLSAFQKSVNRKDNAQARGLHCVKQNSKEVLIEVVQPGVRPRLDRLLAASAPLKVVCGDTATSSGCLEFTNSPAESTDSGVGMSPAVSPTSNGKQSPFYEYSEENRLGMRQRSASESVWNNGGLKGILKKPKRYTRLLSRSASECNGHLLPDEAEATLQVCELLECSEEEREDSVEMAPRQKRVSFSEKVDRKLFKTGQCIASQARKNQKRRESKKRKEERERRASLSLDHEHETSKTDVMSSGDSESKNDDDVFEKPGTVTSSERQDSGFVDGDDEQEEEGGRQQEEVWKAAVRRQRNAVSV